MKKLLLPLAVFSLMILPAQGVFAWEGIQSLNPMPYVSYLNPLPYFGIGENKTNFSLNPFNGFKNCNKCKIDKCDACTGAAAPVCPKCTKAFPKQEPCNTCQEVIVPVYPIVEEPACPCARRAR